jgi:N-acetylglutamate synthase-like GNAT family acetyltransferase
MIRLCTESDFEAIHAIINDAATAYRGVIPDDRWHEPYMTREHLGREIADGVRFWGWESDGKLVGIMGIQDRGEVTLIRHAYVMTEKRRKGIGSMLLEELLGKADRPVLIGTWAAARWAVDFYRKHGFSEVSAAEKDRLLKKYWRIPDRQVETSVVLADGSYRVNTPPVTG